MKSRKFVYLSTFLLLASTSSAQFDPFGSQYVDVDRLGADPLGFFKPRIPVSSVIAGDFNRDGIDDLAIGLASTNLTGDFGDVIAESAGSVHILFGSRTKLTASEQRFVPPTGAINARDFFGGAMAVGNVDRAGVSLAIGIKGDQVGGDDAGSVAVIYSNQSGLDYSSAEIWNQDAPGVSGGSEDFDEFGDAVAFGDFNNNGFDDLVVGVPGEWIGPTQSAGIINVLIGTASGLSSTNEFSIRQDSENVPGTVDIGDRFGDTLAVGNFDCDQYEDLALGAPTESLGAESNAGGVWVFYGSSVGLDSTATQPRRVEVWDQDSSGIMGSAESGDLFGSALIAGDFNGDGCDDLTIGVPGEDIDSNTIDGAGAVAVIYGSPSGLTSSGDQLWTEQDFEPNVSASSSANFGWSLSAADFNKDGFQDLAASARFAQRVSILFGSESGLMAQGASVWTAGRAGTAACDPDAAFRFGSALTTGDFNRDGLPDLAVSSDHGVHVLFNNGRTEIFDDRFESSARARSSDCL